MNKEKRTLEHIRRLAELIDKASFEDRFNSTKLATYLINNGVCDSQEARKEAVKQALLWDIIWKD